MQPKFIRNFLNNWLFSSQESKNLEQRKGKDAAKITPGNYSITGYLHQKRVNIIKKEENIVLPTITVKSNSNCAFVF